MPEHAWSPLTPEQARTLFADFPRPWWVAGGWAIDLHLGGATRPHADIDLAILRGDEVALPALLPGWEICIAHEGTLTPWSGDGPLAPPYHQFWVRPRGTTSWSFEVLLEDHDGDTWQYRRDHRVTTVLSRFGGVSLGKVPYVTPQVALLYKANRHDLAKNAADFVAALPVLDVEARRWLRDAVAKAHPGHPWLAAL